MKSLIVMKVDGKTVGKCDARCYNATTSRKGCDCVCNGENHGVGKQQAVENSADFMRAVRFGSETVRFQYGDDVYRELFGPDRMDFDDEEVGDGDGAGDS